MNSSWEHLKATSLNKSACENCKAAAIVPAQSKTTPNPSVAPNRLPGFDLSARQVFTANRASRDSPAIDVNIGLLT